MKKLKEQEISLTSINLTNSQKKVLIHIKHAPTEKVAGAQVSKGAKFVNARDYLKKLGLVDYENGLASLTEDGEEMMKQEGLTDDGGELTPEALDMIKDDEDDGGDDMRGQPGDDFGGRPVSPFESYALIKEIDLLAEASKFKKK